MRRVTIMTTCKSGPRGLHTGVQNQGGNPRGRLRCAGASGGALMTNIYSVHGMLTASLLIICSCAYIKVRAAPKKCEVRLRDRVLCRRAAQRVPQLRNNLLSEKRGARGTFYKAAVIGQRLHWQARYPGFRASLFRIGHQNVCECAIVCLRASQVAVACVLMAVYLLLRR